MMRVWRGQRDTGLVLAYVANLWLIHWIGPALYLIPAHSGFDPETIRLGLEKSTVGLIGLILGVAIAPLLLYPRESAVTSKASADWRLPRAYIVLGILSFPALAAARNIPSAASLLSSGYKLVVVGLVLSWLRAISIGDTRASAMWLVATIGLPFITVVTMGFAGTGVAATLGTLAFMSGFVRRRRLPAMLALLLLAYVGLSFFVTYMRDRSEIRASVWSGESYEDRLAVSRRMFENFEWFSTENRRHREAVDVRLNQSLLVGMAASELERNQYYANGYTIFRSVLALIPRVIWRDKPDDLTAGSGTLVAEYTGLVYDSSTSVGVGHVMELYINFATKGIAVGFFILGIVLATVDARAARALAENDLHGFTMWFLPGLCALQVGGSMMELTTSAAASVVVAKLTNLYLSRLRPFHSRRGGATRRVESV